MRSLIPLLLLLAACGAPPEAPPAPTTTETAAPGPWEQRIPDMLPAIDACIVAAPGNRTITYAGPDDGGALVRLDGEDGQLDCRVGADGAARIARADPNLTLSGDGAAIFVRGPGENPGGECYEAPEVRDASGAVVGWMLDPLGC